MFIRKKNVMNGTSKRMSRVSEVLDLVEATLGERKPMLTIPEAEIMTGRHRRTIWSWCATGQLSASQTCKGAPYYISAVVLMDFVDGMNTAVA